MNTSLNLSIPKPCTEKWDSFTAAAGGRFCGSCRKTVVDFTKMSDDEILLALRKTSAHACGRFRPEQLKAYSDRPPVHIRPGMTLLKAGFVSLFLMLINKPVFAQAPESKPRIENVRSIIGRTAAPAPQTGIMISGIVKERGGDALPGVAILLKGDTIGTASNAYGEFQFPARLTEGDVLIFCYIGFATEERPITEEMMAQGTMRMELAMEAGFMGELMVTEVYKPKKGLSLLWSNIKRAF